jgi:hypothetical protein
MTKTIISSGFHAVIGAYAALVAIGKFLFSPITRIVEEKREQKLILAVAKPSWAYTNFAGYKESSIESRTIHDSRGRVLAQVKLWIYLGERKCYREVMFLNHLLLTSVGINRLPFLPLEVGQSDTPAALLEVTVREFESWLRSRTAGTQFGIEAARNAATKQQPLRVVSVLPVEAQQPQQQQQPVRNQEPLPRVTPMPQKPPVVPPSQEISSPPANQDQFQRAEPRPDIKPKTEEFTVGILQSVGMQDRTTATRKYKHYCIDITLTDGDSRGMIKRLWGADLERALTESHALLGNRVEVCHHGSMPITNANGSSSYKNSYSMKVLK